MSRDMSAGMEAEIQKPVLKPLLLAYADYRSGAVYTHNGRGTIAWDGHDWIGVGEFLSLDGFDENSDGSSSQATVTLSGVNDDQVAIAYSDDYQGRTAKLWLAAVDESGDLIADPVPIVSGMMNTMADQSSGDTATLQLTIETQMLSQRRTRNWRLTDGHQQLLFPGDLGLEYVAGLAQAKLNWG